MKTNDKGLVMKDILAKYNYEKNNVTDLKLNVVEMLNYESAVTDAKKIMMEMQGIVCDIVELSGVKEKLTSESGNIAYLKSQGYDDANTENSKDKSNDLWEKVKKFIAMLVDKFLALFKKIKDFLISTSSQIEKVLKALKKEVSDINGDADASLLKNELFASKFPIVADFSKKDNLLHVIKVIKDSIYNLIKIGTPTEFDKRVEFYDGWNKIIPNQERYILGVLKFKPTFNYLFCHTNESRLELKHLEVESTYNTNNKQVIDKKDLSLLIEESININHSYGLFVKTIEDSIKKLNNLKPDNGSRFFNDKSAEVNIGVAINSCNMFLSNYETIMNDLCYILACNIKCYNK